MAWAAAGGGLMSRADRMRQLVQAAGVRGSLLVDRFRPGPTPVQVDPESIVIPDSMIARQAVDLCREHSSPALANHCLRTFWWGSLLARSADLRFDAELFWVAALLHDLGLTERFGFTSDELHCFAYEGALAAERFCADQGWSDGRARTVGEAICLHLNITVPVEAGVEAHLVRSGSGLDVIGTGLGRIHPDNRADVLARYPRLGFTEEIGRLVAEQRRRRPGSRMSFLVRNGLGAMIRRGPLTD